MWYLSVEQCSLTTDSDRSSSLSHSLSLPYSTPLVFFLSSRPPSYHPVVFLPRNQSNKRVYALVAKRVGGWCKLTPFVLYRDARTRTHITHRRPLHVCCIHPPALFFSSNHPGTVALVTNTYYSNSLVRVPHHTSTFTYMDFSVSPCGVRCESTNVPNENRKKNCENRGIFLVREICRVGQEQTFGSWPRGEKK